MDAFYASVETLDDPSLAGRPLIVGGPGSRGVVASCNYEARAYGVRSAMPSVRARRLCPKAVFVAGRYGRYAEVSRQIHHIFKRYTPLVEGISLDEAFLDVTGAIRLFGPAPQMAAAIRSQIESELGLHCSVGVAPVKFLAKLASEAAKPKVSPGGPLPGPGVVVIRPGEELVFLHPLPIEALWGVGPATAGRLRGLGMATIGDLAQVPYEVLERALGKANGAHLARLARGIDDRGVEADREVKSISQEETYAKDRRDRQELHVEIVRMSDSVAARMRKAGLVGRTVTLKVRYRDFTTITRSRTSPVGLADSSSMFALASRLLDGVDLDPGVRLLGIGLSNLESSGQTPPEQMTLEFGANGEGSDASSPGDPPPPAPPQLGSAVLAAHRDSSAGADSRSSRLVAGAAGCRSDGLVAGGAGSNSNRQASAAQAVDAIRDRFGDGAVGPAVLLGEGGLRIKRQGNAQWGPAGWGAGEDPGRAED